jgi:hypothetical protein
VQLHQIEMIRVQPFQAAIDAVCNRLRHPRLSFVSRGDMSTLGCQDIFVASMRDGTPDQFLADAITRAGIQETDAAIQRCVEHVPGHIHIRQGQSPNFGQPHA